jgi:hypothetical protein
MLKTNIYNPFTPGMTNSRITLIASQNSYLGDILCVPVVHLICLGMSKHRTIGNTITQMIRHHPAGIVSDRPSYSQSHGRHSPQRNLPTLKNSRSAVQGTRNMCSNPWVVKDGGQEARHVRTADRIHDYLNMTVATPHGRIGNDWR